MKSKKIIIPVIALGVLSLISILGVRSVRANENSVHPLIVQKLAKRFNLSSEEVQQVFDEGREERRQQMQARSEECLDQAVSDGKITEEQKQAILAKKEEMAADREGSTPEKRREEMETHREELKTWAGENGIDSSLIPMLLGRGHYDSFGGPRFGR